MEPDYYEILGVEPTADIALIKAQYRRLVRENHPDIATDKEAAHAMIQEINAAWTVLAHSERRAEYDKRRRRSHESVPSTSQSPSRPRRSVAHDAKAEARKRARVRQVMGGGKVRRDDNPRTRLLGMFLEAAQLYNVEGRSEDAVRVYQNILRADPTNAEAAIRIGDIYAEQKRRDVALAMYERAVRLQPANAEYRRKYNSLRHPDGVAAAAPVQRGGNPWRRSGPESPLADRIARKTPNVPPARTVFDSELPIDEAETSDQEISDHGDENFNDLTSESIASADDAPDANSAIEPNAPLAVPAETVRENAENEKASRSIFQRFRSRLNL